MPSKSVPSVLREVYALGGRVQLEGEKLVVEVPEPLPDSLRGEVRELKFEIMSALGTPLPEVLQAVVSEIRSRLPAPLAGLTDDALLRLLELSLLAAYSRAERRIEQRISEDHTV